MGSELWVTYPSDNSACRWVCSCASVQNILCRLTDVSPTQSGFSNIFTKNRFDEAGCIRCLPSTEKIFFLIGSPRGERRFSLTAQESVRKANLKCPHLSPPKHGFMVGGWNDVNSKIATSDIHIAAEP